MHVYLKSGDRAASHMGQVILQPKHPYPKIKIGFLTVAGINRSLKGESGEIFLSWFVFT